MVTINKRYVGGEGSTETFIYWSPSWKKYALGKMEKYKKMCGEPMAEK